MFKIVATLLAHIIYSYYLKLFDPLANCCKQIGPLIAAHAGFERNPKKTMRVQLNTYCCNLSTDQSCKHAKKQKMNSKLQCKFLFICTHYQQSTYVQLKTQKINVCSLPTIYRMLFLYQIFPFLCCIAIERLRAIIILVAPSPIVVALAAEYFILCASKIIVFLRLIESNITSSSSFCTVHNYQCYFLSLS